MIRILIVEDDHNISKLIAASLSIAGYESQACFDGKEALETIFNHHFDLILLDVMLPGMDGFEIMEHIRKQEVPVIFLTARENVADRVRGLKLGADDYILKPFEPVELLARIEVVLRRCGVDRQVFELDDIVVNLNERVARKAGRAVTLTPKEFDLLVLLLQNQDIALSRDRILATVWGYRYEGETRTVDIHIQQLRKKLDLKDHLKTVPKVGYRLER